MIFGELDITITRCQRKTVSIFVERDGSVSARVPEEITKEELTAVLQSKEYQIHKNLAEWTQLNAQKIERDYVNGQSFLYLGRNYRLQLTNDEFKGIKLKSGYFIISKINKTKAKTYFIDFYKEKLREKLKPILNRYKGQLGVEPQDVKVMELQHRWASCTSKGNLNFHWKCAMAPIDVLNYIVAHELVHIIHPNHTKAFWNDLDKIIPNYDKQLQWLKLNGAGMDL
ncbi:M48 family metallopeptidase [Aquimarina algiphila]|uniref:M48 family metallopeptidase n=1 Tax=Aquimarina algiphila TaxID=2047982 RepID=A0A554VJH4_9FLAO|nr:SprT family zinc-dependent metalloprotease [Aquimarina algiphila]TSE08045.1 M48 family metallopeptidase [Aquimarina algiphila]